jgi:hypothetical protein
LKIKDVLILLIDPLTDGDGSATDLLNEVRYELEYDQLDD